MSLFKPFRGNSASLNNVEKHDGYAYFCTDTGEFFIDYADADGNLFRKQINADEAKKLAGYDIANAINDSVVEIPTSKAILDAISVFDDRIVATDDGELTNVLPDMFGGHTPDEYMLKAEMPEVEKSDWSVNDENDAAYIKNRTHWTDDDGTVHKIDEKYLPDVGVRSWNDLTDNPFGTTTTSILDNYTLNNPSIDMSALRERVENRYQLTISDGFSVGDTVVVTWNGQKYSCKAYALDGVAAVGNSMYMDGEDTGEPFLIGCMAPMLIVMTFDEGAVVSIDIEETKKMSGKYVEGMGYAEVTKSYSDTLTWDGVGSADDPSQTMAGFTVSYHHVSDEVLSLEQLSAGGILTLWQDSEFKATEFTSEQLEDTSSEGFINLGVVAVILTDNVTIQGVTFPKAGIYFMSIPDGYTAGFKVNGHQFEVVTETIHPIDHKYLPTGGFGYSEAAALLKESNAEEYEHPDFGKAWLIENAPELTVGETYTVVYNGTEYNCVCQLAPEGLSQDAEAVAMGNFSVAGGENTGEPFAMMISCMFNRVDVIDLSNASAVKLAIVKEKINKIDQKYLPSGSGGSGGGFATLYYCDDVYVYHTPEGAYNKDADDRVTKDELLEMLNSQLVLLGYAGKFSGKIEARSLTIPLMFDWSNGVCCSIKLGEDYYIYTAEGGGVA